MRLMRCTNFSVARFAALLMLVPILVLFASPAPGATYGNCYWDGTPPICAGSCKPGFVVRSRKSCLSGYKVLLRINGSIRGQNRPAEQALPGMCKFMYTMRG